MGKKKGIQGLSGFAQALSQIPASPNPPNSTDSLANSSLLLTSTSTVNQPPHESTGFATSTDATRGARRTPVERPESDDVQLPSHKRRRLKKNGLLGPGYERVDATGLVPHYTHPSQVPERLQKYFFQRNRYFSLYDQGCLLDEEGWYSITPERIADQIAERCRCGTVLDAFCGAGGNTIAFAKTCERVIALDTSPTRLALARHNAAIYGVEDRIEFILADFLDFARSHVTSLPGGGGAGVGPTTARKIDVVFLSPPWGGPEYLSGSPVNGNVQTSGTTKAENDEGGEAPTHHEFSLSSIRPIHGAELFKLSRKITRNIAYYLPRNTNLDEISQLLKPTLERNERVKLSVSPKGKKNQVRTGSDEQEEMVEVEEEWMGTKLKALTCYFGGLVHGQEHLFDE